jgi:nucleotidyltransferase/DNA polymerase involved in DNA repair
MRKIVCVSLEKDPINKALLDACSSHSSLVEPIGEKELLLDLSPFKHIAEILETLVGTLSQLIKNKACISISTSPLLSILALKRRCFSSEAKSSCRLFKKNDIDIIQVIPGKEILFISTLPLEEFTPLSARECKMLKNLGYSHVGDLADLGPSKLKQILKKDSFVLWQNSCGKDYRPVKSLYPPERLGYSLVLEEGCNNHNQLLLILKESAQELGKLLLNRHASCSYVQLQLIFSDEDCLTMERLLSNVCCDDSRLTLILEQLMTNIIEKPIIELRVFIGDLKPLEFKSQDLFTLRYSYQEDTKKQKQNFTVEKLLERFPGSIKLGMDVDRREKILLFWDPWRFSQERG